MGKAEISGEVGGNQELTNLRIKEFRDHQLVVGTRKLVPISSIVMPYPPANEADGGGRGVFGVGVRTTSLSAMEPTLFESSTTSAVVTGVSVLSWSSSSNAPLTLVACSLRVGMSVSGKSPESFVT